MFQIAERTCLSFHWPVLFKCSRFAWHNFEKLGPYELLGDQSFWQGDQTFRCQHLIVSSFERSKAQDTPKQA